LNRLPGLAHYHNAAHSALELARDPYGKMAHANRNDNDHTCAIAKAADRSLRRAIAAGPRHVPLHHPHVCHLSPYPLHHPHDEAKTIPPPRFSLAPLRFSPMLQYHRRLELSLRQTSLWSPLSISVLSLRHTTSSVGHREESLKCLSHRHSCQERLLVDSRIQPPSGPTLTSTTSTVVPRPSPTSKLAAGTSHQN
jgi:hypothetical protein